MSRLFDKLYHHRVIFSCCSLIKRCIAFRLCKVANKHASRISNETQSIVRVRICESKNLFARKP